MPRSGVIKPDSQSPKPPAPRSRLRGAYRLLLVLAVLGLAVFFIFPLVFKPGVEPPTDLQFGNPSSVVIQVSNQNLTPLTDLEYTCELSDMTPANGSAITDAKVLVRGAVRRMQGRSAIAVRCEAAYLVTAPLKAAEYKLTLNYRMYPWPQRRSSVYRIAAQINANGQITGWKSI
jgi:hypothetical protein